jgi:5-methyltetrahydrofolate--homocysteine methyltransferase
VLELEAAIRRPVPMMISMTLTDLSGRNLSGHTVEAFWASVRHARPLTIGLNCSFGAAQLRPHLAALAGTAETLVMAYPNAGLPNELGAYDEAADETAAQVSDWLRDGLVNVVGGCCGTTPEHIAAIARAVGGAVPRAVPEAPRATVLAGLEPMVIAA